MFHETLGAALSHAIETLKASGCVFDEAEAARPFEFDGIPYPQPGATELPYKNSNFQLTEWKGKGTRKYGHITIWRHETGRYEANQYIL